MKTLENRPTNLPTQPTPLVGRARELDELRTLLLHQDIRLLTLTGAGGTGKTRLALQLAAQSVDAFSDGTWFVNLAALTDPALVLSTVAQTLGIREEPGRPIADSLADQLAAKNTLLVLDNFEQVAEAAAAVADLLVHTTKPKLIVTSRARLQLSAEHEYPVPTLADAEALALFAERAQAVKPTFSVNGNRAVVVEICRRLDHLPLAIELAAARIKLLPEKALLARLDHRLKLLGGGAHDRPARQQTLRAAIDWSYSLLTADEQKLFTRLAVFAGGRTLEAIEAVCNRDGELDTFESVASLVDKSLLRQEETDDGDPRLVMLETIHEYGSERLEASADADEMRQRHAHYFAQLAEAREFDIQGPREEQWLKEMQAELDNFRAAIAWAVKVRDAELALRITGALHGFWYHTGDWSEGRAAVEAALALEAGEPESIARSKALAAAGELAALQGDVATADRYLGERLHFFERRRDDAGIASTLQLLGHLATFRGDFASARDLYERSLDLERGSPAGSRAPWQHLTVCLNNLGWTQLVLGDVEAARATLSEGLDAARARGSRLLESSLLNNLARIALLDDPERARSLLAESLAGLRDLKMRLLLVEAFDLLGRTAARLGDPEHAGFFTGAAEAVADVLAFKGFGDDPAERERALTPARANPGWVDAVARGRQATLEEAFAKALDFASGSVLPFRPNVLGDARLSQPPTS